MCFNQVHDPMIEEAKGEDRHLLAKTVKFRLGWGKAGVPTSDQDSTSALEWDSPHAPHALFGAWSFVD